MLVRFFSSPFLCLISPQDNNVLAKCFYSFQYTQNVQYEHEHRSLNEMHRLLTSIFPFIFFGAKVTMSFESLLYAIFVAFRLKIPDDFEYNYFVPFTQIYVHIPHSIAFLFDVTIVFSLFSTPHTHKQTEKKNSISNLMFCCKRSFGVTFMFFEHCNGIEWTHKKSHDRQPSSLYSFICSQHLLYQVYISFII